MPTPNELISMAVPTRMQTRWRFGVHLDAGGGGGAHVRLGRYRHADQLLRRRPGPSLHRSGALEPRQGMLLNNRRPASFRPPARNRNQTSDQKVSAKRHIRRAPANRASAITNIVRGACSALVLLCLRGISSHAIGLSDVKDPTQIEQD